MRAVGGSGAPAGISAGECGLQVGATGFEGTDGLEADDDAVLILGDVQDDPEPGATGLHVEAGNGGIAGCHVPRSLEERGRCGF